MTEQAGQPNPLDEILPARGPEHAQTEPPLDAFEPWHLPRKHHVRKNQWGAALEKLIDEMPDRMLIKYLCLPGKDLLDVEIMAAICRQKNRQLRYLGFDQNLSNTPRSTQRIAAEQIIQQTNVIDRASQVLPDNFTSIARPESIGSRHLRDGGSYDVVNLDMCDAFTTDECTPTHQAMVELVTHQCNRRAEPWLLFITTRSEISRLQQNELEIYARTIESNATSSASFRQNLASVAEVTNVADVQSLIKSITDRLPGDTYLAGRWIAIAVGKWLIGVAKQPAPWRVDLLSVCAYRTGLLSINGLTHAGNPPNLFSLAFKFQKIHQARQDPAGIAAHASGPYAALDETALAEKLAKCVELYTADLDCMMQNNVDVHRVLAQECESLLSVRYYSVEAYKKWVGQLPQIRC
jgi:hypothetical protein